MGGGEKWMRNKEVEEKGAARTNAIVFRFHIHHSFHPPFFFFFSSSSSSFSFLSCFYCVDSVCLIWRLRLVARVG